MSEPKAAVAGIGLFVPGYPGFCSWSAQAREEGSETPLGHSIDPRSRRRASGFARALADSYAEAVRSAALDPTQVASVFGSALGEASTMIGLLDQMWSEDGELSPMRFATSVHNAASGIVSITSKNQGFTTSVGADFDTPAMALAEAFGWLCTHEQPVIVACGDESVPEKLVREGAGWSLLSVAVALLPEREAPSDLVRVAMPLLSERACTIVPDDVDPSVARNPQMGLLDLAQAVARRDRGVLRLDRGRGRGFSVEIT